MREILFRGKTLDGRWVEGFYGKTTVIGVDTYIAEVIYSDETTLFSAEWDEVIPETVGQYTGLTDKNGKKIFEGDILKTSNGRVNSISVVKYGLYEPKMFFDLIEYYVRPRPEEKAIGFFAETVDKGEIMMLFDSPYCIEVIGNIHDTPELLKGDTSDA